MKVLIIDDDFFITTALKTILEADPEIQVCGLGKNGKEALSLYASLDPDILLMDIRMEEMSLYASLDPDILLMDIRMEEMDGLAASGEILSRYPQARILLLTTFLDDEYIIQALKLGAKGYLLKQDYNSIIPALKAVYSGQTVYGSEISFNRSEKFSLGRLSHQSQGIRGDRSCSSGPEQQRNRREIIFK